MHVDQLYKCWSNYHSNAQQEHVEQSLLGMATEATMRATDINMMEYSRLSIEAVTKYPDVWDAFLQKVNVPKYVQYTTIVEVC